MNGALRSLARQLGLKGNALKIKANRPDGVSVPNTRIDFQRAGSKGGGVVFAGPDPALIKRSRVFRSRPMTLH